MAGYTTLLMHGRQPGDGDLLAYPSRMNYAGPLFRLVTLDA